jgi:hypothetical protein
MVSALNREIALDGSRLLEALVAPLRGIQLRLDVRVGDEKEAEIPCDARTRLRGCVTPGGLTK